ncbi:unnamed protein product [Colias eurytheme]|nr:unnamed protein product [Colias eurytheme]
MRVGRVGVGRIAVGRMVVGMIGVTKMQLISVVSPSRTRPSSALLPIYRKDSTSGSSTTSSGVSEVAVALRRRQKKPHALRMPQKKRGLIFL